MFDFSIVTFNVRGLRGKEKRVSIFEHLKIKGKNGIFLLQETHFEDNDKKTLQHEWGTKDFYLCNGGRNCRGTAIFISNLRFKELFYFSDNIGRLQILSLELLDDCKKILVVNIYNENDENSQVLFLEKLYKKLHEIPDLQEHEIIIGGDWNCFLNRDLDCRFGNPCTKIRTIAEISKIKSKFDLIDIFRVKHPILNRYTWCRPSPFTLRRLDYFLISNTLLDHVEISDILQHHLSDHRPVRVRFVPLNPLPRGAGIWKFNSTLLKDPEFMAKAKTFLEKVINDYQNLDPKALLELIKYKFKCFAREISLENAKNYRKEEKELTEKIKNFEDRALESEAEEYKMTKMQLENIIEIRIKGQILRSKANFYEYGERSSKFFLNLEKKRAEACTLHCLYDTNSVLQTDYKEILKVLNGFYSKLFEKKFELNIPDARDFLERLNLPKISEDHRNMCEQNITKDDLFESFSSMQGGKSPGNDGFEKEFYLAFWDSIGDQHFASINKSKIDGCLSASQVQSMIKLIPKKDRDKKYVSNLRPISLVNCDTKSVTKSMASKLKQTLPTIIHSDQTAYVFERNIGESSRLIADILETSLDLNVEGYIVTMDIQKAFDSVSHEFLLLVLEFYGFGPNFISWIKLLLLNQQSSVFNGGESTGYFKLGRGCRQGDPISAYLFIMVIEVFFVMVRKSNLVKGLKIFNFEYK